MKKFTEFMLISITGLALAGCNSSDTVATEVTYEALLNTGTNGYKINVDIDDSEKVHNSIDYYFCTNGVGDLDYFANTSSYGPWEGDEPDFDYGELDSEAPAFLDFWTDAGAPSPYSIISEERVLIEGQTYEFDMWAFDGPGTIYIRSISDFDCSIVMEPVI